MMIFAIVISILSLLTPVSTVFAQSSTFNQAYTEYNTSFDAYKTAESNYEIKRGQYLSSQTVAATGEAQTATYNLLQARDETVAKYLTMLKQRLSEAVGVDTTDREIAFTNLDTEIAWFEDHKSKTQSSESLDDLVSDSKKANDQYNKTTLKLIYKTLGQIAIGKETYLRQKQLSVLDELNQVLAQIRQDNTVNIDLFDRSSVDIQNTIDKSAGKNADALSLLSGLDKSKSPSGTYDSVVAKVSEGLVYLKQANTTLREIIFRIITS